VVEGPVVEHPVVRPDRDLSADESTPPAQADFTDDPEAPLTNHRTSRPAPRPGAVRVTPGPKPVSAQVKRARTLVWIGSAALATLLLAFVLGGWWIALNLVADVALVSYVRHLRGIAKQQQAARRSRPSGARAGAARQPVREASRTGAAASRAERPQRRTVPVREHAAAAAARSARLDEQIAAETVIDLTDDASLEDCPTTELMSARAV
jgi:hypothetical protein